MVSRIPFPVICDTDLLDAIIDERQGGRNRGFFNGIHAEWLQRVQTYLDEGGSPEVVLTWPLANKNSTKFLTLYKSPKDGSTQGTALRSLRDHGYQFCPSCGEAGSPNTLDHFLPREKYPHFSVTIANLTPMCSKCQGKKSDHVGNAVNPRFFIHPYFDDFASQQLLELEIEPPFDIPTFNLRISDAVMFDARPIVEQHVQRLELPRRFRKFFRDRYRQLLRQAQDCRHEDVDLQAFLRVTKRSHARVGLNYWDHVFYLSVLENDNLIAYLENGELPAFL